MDKLIVLLNEFIDDWQERLYACYSLDDWFDKFFHTKDGEWIIEEAQVISKKFWFIEWLVENKEINRKKLDSPRFTALVDNTLDSYYALLMLLSIQDEPIDFLSSILK